MDSGQQQSKEPVSALLAGPYGHPFHPILVTIPIGAWVCSLVFDVASHLTSTTPGLTTSAQWLIGIGVLGALAAASVGLLDLLAIPTATPAHRTALLHAGLNLTVTLAYAANFAWRYRAGDSGTATASGPLILSILSLAALSVSGYLGGKLAYRYGVRVADETVQAEGFEAAGTTADRRPPPPATPAL
jgi:uncharacterized membrane protein